MRAPANPAEKLATFTDRFSPRTVATYNNNDIMVAKLEGPFHWHKANGAGDVLENCIKTFAHVRFTQGLCCKTLVETAVEPRGEVHILLIEPTGTDQVDSLRDLASGTNGIAVGSLVRILSDPATSPRQQLRACGVVLGYRARDPAVTELAKRCLETLCASGENVDHQIEASELLRRCQDPKIMPQIERPSIAPRHVDTEEEIAERCARRRAHCRRLTAEIAEQYGYKSTD
jgi:hypothetical protein